MKDSNQNVLQLHYRCRILSCCLINRQIKYSCFQPGSYNFINPKIRALNCTFFVKRESFDGKAFLNTKLKILLMQFLSKLAIS